MINDTDEAWRGGLTLSRQRLDGGRLADTALSVEVQPRTSTAYVLPAEVAQAADPAAEIVVARLDGIGRVHTFVEDVDLAWQPDPLEVAVAESGDGYDVTVTARSFVRDVTLLADRLADDAVVDDALVSLPAGESATFHVRTSVHGLGSDLARPPALRTANDLQRTSVSR